MSRPGKALIYMLPLLVVSTILVLGHPAMTQQNSPRSVSAQEAPRAVPAAEPVAPRAAEVVETVAVAEPPRRVPAAASAPRLERRPEPTSAEPAAKEEIVTPAGTRYRKVSVRMRVTAYCPCPKCCGSFSDGKTASGKRITYNGGNFVAADTSLLPFGTMLSIPGYNGGRPVPVEDRGGRIKGMRLDVFYYSHHQARQWGSQWLDVTVYVPVE